VSKTAFSFWQARRVSKSVTSSAKFVQQQN